MPPRSKVITTLPPAIRKEVERRMLAKRFSDYEGLAQWVREQGYDLSEDSLWRYGKSLRQEFTAVRLSILQARVLIEKTADHKGRMMEALLKVAQQKLLLALAQEDGRDLINLCRLVEAVAHLARVYIPHQESTREFHRRKKVESRMEMERLLANRTDESSFDDDWNDDPANNQLPTDNLDDLPDEAEADCPPE